MREVKWKQYCIHLVAIDLLDQIANFLLLISTGFRIVFIIQKISFFQ